MDRARPVRGDAGATLTWHVGRYQVLPRHRVDAERRRMCDSRCLPPPSLALPPSADPFRLSSRLPLRAPRAAITLSLFSLCSRRVNPRLSFVFARGEIHPCVVSPRRAPPLHYHRHPPPPSPHYHHCWRQQVDDVYRLGIATMQPIFRRNYHPYPLSSILSLSLLRKRE